MDTRTERYHVQRAVKSVRRFIENERAMRERVFRSRPQVRTVKVAEANQALDALDLLVERLYEARPDLRPVEEPQAEQVALPLEVEG